MRVSLLFNTKSGRGKAGPLAETLSRALTVRGHNVAFFDVSTVIDATRDAVSNAEVVCVLGGDGSVHHALPHLMNSSVSMYHVPLGTENLFSRDWRMTSDPEAVVGAVEGNRTEMIDIGMAGNRPFALMVSLGPDASVIQRVQDARTGPITHASYFTPVIAEFLSPSLRPLSIWVDGRQVVDAQRGICVIANSSQYGGRIDPAALASLTDGMLDLYFAPASNGIDVARHLLNARFRLTASEQVVSCRGTSIKLDAGDLPSQIDGEPFQATTGELSCSIVPQALRVLLP